MFWYALYMIKARQCNYKLNKDKWMTDEQEPIDNHITDCPATSRYQNNLMRFEMYVEELRRRSELSKQTDYIPTLKMCDGETSSFATARENKSIKASDLQQTHPHIPKTLRNLEKLKEKDEEECQPNEKHYKSRSFDAANSVKIGSDIAKSFNINKLQASTSTSKTIVSSDYDKNTKLITTKKWFKNIFVHKEKRRFSCVFE